MIRTVDNKVYPLMIFVSFTFAIVSFLSYAIVPFLLEKYRRKEHKDQIPTLPYKTPKILSEKFFQKQKDF